jgi:hypothetical protein
MINRTALRDTLASLRGPRAVDELQRLQAQLGGLEARAVAGLGSHDLRRSEFSVFSQFGEDGIVQFLVQRVPIEHEVFVEFGVEDYSESNTRFLLVHDNWRGLILDGGQGHVEFARRSGLSWRHHLDAVSAFVDRDNINGLIRSAGIDGDIGLLSIDIDGNDLWVLEAIDVVSPRILVVEYNSTFGPDAAVTVPYDRGFLRREAHFSHLYWGASLAGLDRVAARKGYRLVGGNSAGNNAFWVRDDLAGEIPAVTVADAYAPSRFRESRAPDGALSYVGDHRERLRLMRALPLWDVDAGHEATIGERFDV